MKLPLVSIVILNWKQSDLTIDTIESFLKIQHSQFSYQLIIVDNGSPSSDFEKLQTYVCHKSSILLLQTGSNLGYVGGNNFGINQALTYNPDYILLCNNDVIVDQNFLSALVQYLESHPKVAIVGPKIYFAPGHEFHYSKYKSTQRGKVIWSVGGHLDWNNIYGSNLGIDEVDHGQFSKVNQKIDFISGCCQLLRTSLIKQIGLLDPSYFMYLEDADLCQRALSRHYQLAIVPQSIIWHINAGSSQAGGGSLHDYFLTRNRLIFGLKYAKTATKFALLKQSLVQLFTSQSKWQKQGIIDYYLRRLGKGSWK